MKKIILATLAIIAISPSVFAVTPLKICPSGQWLDYDNTCHQSADLTVPHDLVIDAKDAVYLAISKISLATGKLLVSQGSKVIGNIVLTSGELTGASMAVFLGLDLGQTIDDLDNKYNGGKLTHNNAVTEAIGDGLEAAGVFPAVKYIDDGKLADDVKKVLKQAKESINSNTVVSSVQ